MTNNLTVDAARIEGDLEALAALTDEGNRCMRRAFTKERPGGRSAPQRAACPPTPGKVAVSVPGKDTHSHTSDEWAEIADVALGYGGTLRGLQRLDLHLEN